MLSDLPHCHEVFTQGHNLAITLFLGALLGSVSHCSSMCGPFVLAQVSGFEAPKEKRIDIWLKELLIPYHFGRLTTYVFLGVMATVLSVPLLKIPSLHLLPSLLLALAGLMFLASAFSQLLPVRYFDINFCGMPDWISRRISKLLPSHSLLSGYVLGVLLGFLPCGLVYAAIIAVMATGNIAESALAMTAFALGTIPMLVLITLGGKMLINKKYSWIKSASAILMTFGSIMLFVMAGKGLV